MQHFFRPAEKLEVERRLSEAFEDDGGSRFVEDARDPRRGRAQSLLGLVRVVRLRDAQRNVKADPVAAEAPVRHRARDEFRVRHDQMDVVVRADDGRAGSDLDDVAHHLVDLDPVADHHGPLEQDDDSGDEVLHDVLEAEADPDAEGGAEGGEARGVHAHRVQGQHASHDPDEVGEDAPDGVPCPHRERRPGEEAFRDESPRDARSDPRQRDDPSRDQKARHGHLRAVYAEETEAQEVAHGVSIVQVRCRNGKPSRYQLSVISFQF
jgi:hypothetical protein